MTQLYRKHSGVIALRFVTTEVNLAQCYLPCCVVICRETFMAPALSVCGIFRENWIWLELKICIHFVQFFFTNLLTNMPLTCKEKCFIKFVCHKGWSTKRICIKSFQPRSGLSAVLKISARLRRRTWLNGRLVVDDCRLPHQNRITSTWLSWYAVKKAT